MCIRDRDNLMTAIRHQIRLGTHAEKAYLQRTKGLFDELVLNANLVEATRASLSVFALNLGKPFVIDPTTYAFALDPRLLQAAGAKKPRVRSTFVSLADQYGLPLGNRLGRTPLQPNDLSGQTLDLVVERVVRYQRDRLADALSENAEFLLSDMRTSAAALRPRTVLAPYFVEDFATQWKATNLRSVQLAVEAAGDEVSAVAAYDTRAPVSNELAALAAAYAGCNAKSVIIWATDLDEHFAAQELLNRHADLVTTIAHSGKDTSSAYGGYFALLLSFRGLGGYCLSLIHI